MAEITSELENTEKAFFSEIDDFECNYKHKRSCRLFNKTGYCVHVERAERKKFSEKRMLLLQLRLNLSNAR